MSSSVPNLNLTQLYKKREKCEMGKLQLKHTIIIIIIQILHIMGLYINVESALQWNLGTHLNNAHLHTYHDTYTAAHIQIPHSLES